MEEKKTNTAIASPSPANTLRTLLTSCKKEIASALPKHVTADRMLRIAMTEARKVPKLLQCTPPSFLGAIIQAAQLGLEPGGFLGHCYLVPFRNNRAQTDEVQLIVGYRGFIDLAYRSGKVSRVIARAVYEGDIFSYEFGGEEKLIHRPLKVVGIERKLTYVYVCVFLKGEEKPLFDVMDSDEIEEARRRSKSPNKGPWVEDFEAMAKKSVVRRLFKFMPVSIEIQRAVGLDEAADYGESQSNALLLAAGEEELIAPQSKTEEFREKISQGSDLSELKAEEIMPFEREKAPT